MPKTRSRPLQPAKKNTDGKKPRNQTAPGNARSRKGKKSVPSSTTARPVKKVHRFCPGTGV